MKKESSVFQGIFFVFEQKKIIKSSKKFTMWENVLIKNSSGFELL